MSDRHTEDHLDPGLDMLVKLLCLFIFVVGMITGGFITYFLLY